MTLNERKETFEELKARKATCFEMACNGFIRLYEEGEVPCECTSCIAMVKPKEDWDTIYTTVPIDKKWYETDEAKQRLVELVDMVNEKYSFGKDGTMYCRECKNDPVACVCMDIDEITE